MMSSILLLDEDGWLDAAEIVINMVMIRNEIMFFMVIIFYEVFINILD